MEDNSVNNLAALQAQSDQLKKSLADLRNTLVQLDVSQKTMAKSIEENTKSFKEYGDQMKGTGEVVKELNDQITNNAKLLDSAKGSVVQNKAVLADLQAQYDALSKSQNVNTTQSAGLKTQIDQLSKTIADQETQITKSAKAFDFHKGVADSFKSSMETLKKQAGTFGPELEHVTKGFNVLKTGVDVVKTGFQGVGGAIKATGFGLLVLVLESLAEYFTKNNKGIAQLRGGLAAVGVVVEKVKGFFAKFGEAIMDVFSHPVVSLKALIKLIEENLMNRLKAFGVIVDGIIHLDFKKIADGFIQAGTGVTNATDKIVAGYKKIKSVVSEATDKVIETYTKVNQETAVSLAKGTAKLKTHLKKQAGLYKQHAGEIHQTQSQMAMLSIQQMASNFNDQLDAQHKNYQTELADLQKQYDNKLITQEDYNQKSQELQDKYHEGVGAGIGDFSKQQLAEAQQLQQELLEAQQNAHDRQMAIDEKGAKKPITPGAKLEAEKKLISDQYDFEIEQAAGNVTKQQDLEKQKQVALTQIAQQYAQQRKDFELQTAQQVSNAAFSILQNSIKSQSDAKIKGLESQKTAELSNKSLTASQRKAIEDKYQKQENAEKVKAFKAEQKVSILQAVINGALAITKAEAQTGVLGSFVIPGIIAQTAIQVATIAAQKPPAYAKGGRFVSDGRGAVLAGYSRTDDTNAYLRSGEAVVVSEAMRDPWARNLVSAINVAYGGRDFSTVNSGRGYAIGGIFTDGGNTNRYYNQPVNDMKNLANTVAYQMINNFPPVYVDVKDINNQQNILAQTVNRVNL